jgi:hypothetical protein
MTAITLIARMAGKFGFVLIFKRQVFFPSVIGGHKVERAMTIQSSAQRLEIKRPDS